MVMTNRNSVHIMYVISVSESHIKKDERIM